MASSSIFTNPSPESLKEIVAGDVLVPGDDGYDDARAGFFLNADQRPAVVVLAEFAQDVVAAVQFARSIGMRIAPQGTGHGALPLEALDGAMLLRTSRMRRVEIDPVACTAWAEAGAEWRDVTVPAAEYGLAALAGTSPSVGVTGYTLGGGLGWLGRRYGLASNSVTAAELVTMDGRLRRVDARHEPDLFWAVRGGGGSVGVITALEMTLFPLRELYAGALYFPIERVSEVLHSWRQWTATVPDELTSIGRILRVPDLPGVPEPLRGRGFALVEAAYTGDALTGAELLRPLRDLGPELDTFATIPAPQLQALHMDPAEPVAGCGDGVLLSDLDVAGIDALVSLAGPSTETPLSSVEVRHLGGALSRPAERGGAQPQILGQYLMFAGGLAPTAEQTTAVRTHIRAIVDALTPLRATYDFHNLTGTRSYASAVLPLDAYRRLREIKSHCDPDEVLISAHPVRPART